MIEARKNGFMLEHNKFLYVIDKTVKDVKYYKCRHTSCKARGMITMNTFKISTPHHNHENDTVAIIRSQVRQKVLEKAKEDPTMPTAQVYYKVVNAERKRLSLTLSKELVGTSIPTLDSCRSSIIRSRREMLPAQPQRREDIIAGDWCMHEGENFLLINDGFEEKIMAFGTKQNILMMAEAKRVFLDGTFYTCPSLFKQLYTMHIVYRGKMIPVLYALLPNKTTATYARLLKKVTEVTSEFGACFKPETFTVDFERAAINAIEELFPAAEIKGCLFHFTKCIWSKTQRCGLQTAYGVDMEVKTFVKRLSAMPLLNPIHIEDAWLIIHGDAPRVSGIDDLIEYFVSTWLDPDTSLFDVSIWNIYGLQGDRTNNKLEGWHSGLKKLIKKAHPNLYEFVEFIKQDQDNHNTNVLHLSTGNPSHPRRKTYRDIDIAIQNLTDMYNLGQKTPIEYLDSVSYKLSLES